MNDTGKTILILTAGFVAGAVAGILFAPDMGEKTRERIAKKAGDLSDEVEKHYQEEIEKLKKKVAKMKTELRTKMDEVKTEAEEVAEKASEKINKAADKVKEKVAANVS